MTKQIHIMVLNQDVPQDAAVATGEILESIKVLKKAFPEIKKLIIKANFSKK